MEDRVVKPKEVIEFCKKVEVDFPKNSILYWLKGTALSLLGDYDESLKLLEKALKKSPNNRDFIYSKGYCLLRSKNYDEALKTFDEVIFFVFYYKFW